MPEVELIKVFWRKFTHDFGKLDRFHFNENLLIQFMRSTPWVLSYKAFYACNCCHSVISYSVYHYHASKICASNALTGLLSNGRLLALLKSIRLGWK